MGNRMSVEMEEEKLRGTVKGLTKSLERVTQKWRSKEEEIRELTKRLEKLKGRANKVTVVATTEPQQGRDAILIVPEELWELILSQLTDPEDLWNCTNSCQLFETVLHRWKTSWLFEQAFPHLFRYLPKDDGILKCRLVSKGWNKVVDQFFEGHQSLRPQNHEQDQIVDRRILPFVNPLVEKGFDLVNVVNFTPDSGPEGPAVAARLIGRALTLTIQLNQTDEDGTGTEGGGLRLSNAKIWENVLTFLRNYGEEIWYLTVKLILGEAPTESVKEGVRDFLLRKLSHRLVNLRRLRVLILPYQGIDPTGVNAEWIAPAPPKLEVMELTELTSSVVLGLIVKSTALETDDSHLRVIYLLSAYWDGYLFRWDWPNLTELHLQLVKRADTLANLAQARERIPQLRLLGLGFVVNYTGSFHEVLEAVGHLSATLPLRTLRLKGDLFGLIFEDMESDLCMPPSLTTLELEREKWLVLPSYNFLLRFPFLENLHLFYKPSERVEEGQIRGLGSGIGLLPESEFEEDEDPQEPNEEEEFVQVNKHLFRKQMYKSNIWKLLPRLKLFSFQWDTYTRSGYEQVMEKYEVAEEIQSETQTGYLNNFLVDIGNVRKLIPPKLMISVMVIICLCYFLHNWLF